jgi:ABC-type dipeptide/oligopeptide/nickel transport system ATPase component
MPNLLLEVKDLETQLSTPDGTVHAVNGIFFSLKKGETHDRK